MTKEHEHIPFPKIPRFSKRKLLITEKIDGTNACIRIYGDGEIVLQSRNRIISTEYDNYGFAAWVNKNREAILGHEGGLRFDADGDADHRAALRGGARHGACLSAMNTPHPRRARRAWTRSTASRTAAGRANACVLGFLRYATARAAGVARGRDHTRGVCEHRTSERRLRPHTAINFGRGAGFSRSETMPL